MLPERKDEIRKIVHKIKVETYKGSLTVKEKAIIDLWDENYELLKEVIRLDAIITKYMT